jgi:hypothetical protein
MEILNHGHDPTIGSAGRLDVIDITQGSFGLLVNFKISGVFSEPSL